MSRRMKLYLACMCVLWFFAGFSVGMCVMAWYIYHTVLGQPLQFVPQVWA